MTDYRQFPKVDVRQMPDPLARAVVNNAIAGKMNVVQEITLTANSATTTLSDDLITEGSFIGLMSMSANAAAALANIYFDATTTGSVTINHANNAQTDRTFRYAVLG